MALGDLMNIEETAEFLGITTGYVRRFAREGKLKGMKVGQRAWVFDRADVEAFAAIQRPKPGRRPKDSAPPG